MRLVAGLALLLVAATPVWAQQAVRDDAKAFATEAARAAANTAGNEATAITNLPGYNGGTAPERAYLDNPLALESAGAPAARSNEGAVLVIDGNTVRPRVSAVLVDETVARGNIITQTPETYALGVDPNGTTGQCVELPPGVSSAGTFEATCNAGAQLIPEASSCNVPLQHNFTNANDYRCTKVTVNGAFDINSGCGAYTAPTCTLTMESAPTLYQVSGCIPGACFNIAILLETYKAVCSAPVAGTLTGSAYTHPITQQAYPPSFTSIQTYVNSEPDLTQCQGLANDVGCSSPVDVCTDAAPATRDVGGTMVTQSCWAWSRTYQCNRIGSNNDCTALDANAACHYDRTVCLDDPQVGACQVEDRIYTCPVPASTTDPKQYVCGGDLYCIGSECEVVTHEASTEFKDAVVGLHTLDQAAKEFDEVDYRLFKGAGESCHKPVFGLANCCGGNGIPLIGACSSAERLLAVKIDKGFTHYIGTYCSGSFLGICHSKRQVYCSFTSKLTRILQEQGRPQIGKTWGTPKAPVCDGFTVDEFARLDLSVMDFAEIYTDFIDAARLPDEAATMTDIQQKIRDYYARGGN